MTQENKKKPNLNDVMQDVYNDLPFQIRRACRTMGTTPEQIGIDLSKIAKGYKNCWDINPEQRHLWLKILCVVKCSKCSKPTKGVIIVQKSTLKIIDSSGFVIFADPVCDNCLEEKEEK